MNKKLRKSKADHLLEGLVYKEINKFNKFIINRLGDSGQHILKYWEFRLEQKKLTGSFILTDIKGDFSRKIISDFVKILEKFYANKGFEKDFLSEKGYLIRELRDRHIYKLFNSLLDDTKKYHKSSVKEGYMNYISLFRLNLEEYFLYNSRNEGPQMYKTSKNMSSISEIIYSQSKLLEYINKKLYGQEYDDETVELNDAESIVKYVLRNSDKLKSEYQSVYMMYLMYDMIVNDKDDSKTLVAMNYIKKNFNKFTVNYLQLCYETIIRFYIQKVNTGNSKSLQELYKVLSEIEKKELFSKIQHIQPLNFLTAISVALAFNDVNFAEMFMLKYSNKMNLEYRKQTYTICEAMIKLYKGDFNTAKRLLLNDKTKEISMYLFSKATLMKSLYELNDTRILIPLIDTVKHYLNRHIPSKGPYKESIFEFLNYINNLSTAKRKNGRGASRLLDKLNNENNFFQKKWIVLKAEELKKLALNK